jgi:adenosine kinase
MSSSTPILLGICNPLLDISAPVAPELLTKYGLQPSSACLAEDKHLPLYPELVKDYPVEYIAGGAGQNSIRAAQWMLGQPGATAYIGCIGKDEYGKILRTEAESDGVTVHYLEDETTPTGTCAVLITDKDRSLVANLAAANCYKKDHFDSPAIQDVVSKVEYIYITGFFVTVSVDTILAAAELAVQHNKVFMMNLSAPFLIDFFWDGKFEKLLPYVDVLFGNESEAAALAKRLGCSDDAKEVALKAAALPKINGKRDRMVIITQGSKATVVAYKGEVQVFAVPPVPAEEIVDLNGAGDSFVGGFLAKYTQNKSLEEAVAAGHYCAGVTIRTSGTTFKGKSPAFTFTQ